MGFAAIVPSGHNVWHIAFRWFESHSFQKKRKDTPKGIAERDFHNAQ